MYAVRSRQFRVEWNEAECVALAAALPARQLRNGRIRLPLPPPRPRLPPRLPNALQGPSTEFVQSDTTSSRGSPSPLRSRSPSPLSREQSPQQSPPVVSISSDASSSYGSPTPPPPPRSPSIHTPSPRPRHRPLSPYLPFSDSAWAGSHASPWLYDGPPLDLDLGMSPPQERHSPIVSPTPPPPYSPGQWENDAGDLHSNSSYGENLIDNAVFDAMDVDVAGTGLPEPGSDVEAGSMPLPSTPLAKPARSVGSDRKTWENAQISDQPRLPWTWAISKKNSEFRRPIVEGKWWSVSKNDFNDATDNRKRALGHTGRIMETELGERVDDGDECSRCQEEESECWRYTKRGRGQISKPGDACARCRHGIAKCTLSLRGTKGFVKKKKKTDTPTPVPRDIAPKPWGSGQPPPPPPPGGAGIAV